MEVYSVIVIFAAFPHLAEFRTRAAKEMFIGALSFATTDDSLRDIVRNGAHSQIMW
jgi:hypothetical protein